VGTDRVGAGSRRRRGAPRLKRALTAVSAAAVVWAAAGAALPFRRAALARLEIADLSWDAARHTLAALDLFDELRRFHVFAAFGTVLSQHWWPPLHAVVLAPLFALFGVSLSTATLPSLLAHLGAALCCALLAARLAPSLSPVAALAAGALFVRAPHVLEVSAWAMLESLGAFLTLLAWLLFARRESPRSRAAAYAATAALFLLKYLYGLFVSVTFAVLTVLELEPDERRALRESVSGLGTRLRLPAAALILLGAARLVAERAFPGVSRFVPSLPNLFWLALVSATVAALLRRRAVAVRARSLPRAVRSFLLFAVLPPCAWLLDPANMRAFFNQLFDVPAKGSHGVLAQASGVVNMAGAEFVPSLTSALVLVCGLATALVVKDRSLRALAIGVLWPTALMCLSRHELEPRYLVTLAPAAFAAAGAGLARLTDAGPARLRGALAWAAAFALVVFVAVTREGFQDLVEPREAYRFRYTPEDLAVVRAMELAPSGTLPVFAAVPPDHAVSPTLRLLWRWRFRALPPSSVDAVQGAPDAAARLFERSGLPDAELVTFENGAGVVRRARATAAARLRAPAATPSAEARLRSPTGSRPSR
jgi:4-amino-4-deoxy-L-arabinose transferase-like glycosyltransferase